MIEQLAIRHKFIIMYKPNTNGLVERTNKMLYSVIAKKTETRANVNDWDFKIHHAMWIYNSTFKTATGFSPFRLIYDIEILLPIEYELLILHIAMKTCLD